METVKPRKKLISKADYKGVLAEPIRLSEHGKHEDIHHSYSSQFYERLFALYEHYGLDYFDMSSHPKMVNILAKNHIACFQYKTEADEPGRKKENTQWASLCWKIYVLKLKNPKLGTNEACKRLVDKDDEFKGKKASTLARRAKEYLASEESFKKLFNRLKAGKIDRAKELKAIEAHQQWRTSYQRN